MKKVIRRVLVLGILIFSLILMSVGIGLSDELAIMHPNKKILDQWVRDYENADRAEDVLIPLRIQAGGSLSLLDHLQYDPVTRDQGLCGNCWVWAGTGVMGIALDVQEGIKDRLSIQYLNSCKAGSYACCGGNLTAFANFYNSTKKAIPWSNTNASFQDANRTCEDGHSLVSCSSISTSPNYPIESITPLTITTYGDGVSQAEAINNIKNVLHNNKAIYFAFCLPNSTAWNDFYNFWSNYDESAVYDIDKFCGIPWNDDEGGCHAVLCVGYNDNDPNNSYWIMLNSWGTAGGRRPNGLFRVNMDMDYSCVNPPYYSFYWQTLNIDFGEVSAWNLCIKDVAYPTLYKFNLEYNSHLIRGQAFYPDPTSFPAPLTGYYDPISNQAFFNINYKSQHGLRFYLVDVSTMTGWTWGIYHSNSSFYDGPRQCTLEPCPPEEPQEVFLERESGAFEEEGIRGIEDWDHCVKDTQFITLYGFNLEYNSRLMRGQAVATWEAPLTGYFDGSGAYFGIGYLNDNLRFYVINVGAMSGYTWGIYGSNSDFYDVPGPCTLEPCPSEPLEKGEIGNE